MPERINRGHVPAIIAWASLGPAAFCAVAVGYSAIAMAGHEAAAVRQALVSTAVLALGLSFPLFLYFSLKLAELAEANRKLGIVAATDGLTACLNRTAFTTLVDTCLSAAARRSGHMMGALLIIDADRFKIINDTYGHQNGDAALALIAKALRASVRSGDSVGRIGGEEFGVFLPGVDRTVADAVAERLRRAVENIDFAVDGRPHSLSISIGGVVFDRWARFEDLFRQADASLYAAKKAGRNSVRLTGFVLEGEGLVSAAD